MTVLYYSLYCCAYILYASLSILHRMTQFRNWISLRDIRWRPSDWGCLVTDPAEWMTIFSECSHIVTGSTGVKILSRKCQLKPKHRLRCAECSDVPFCSLWLDELESHYSYDWISCMSLTLLMHELCLHFVHMCVESLLYGRLNQKARSFSY
jgi:hypothetical protein